MPKVQEYLPEQEAQGPVGRTEPMLDQVSMYGRGIEEAGRGIENAYDVLHQRQTQAEVSDSYAATSEQRASYADRITQARNDGSINDPNSPNSLDKIKQDYQDWSDKQYDTYDTAGGKNAFNRASARIGGVILQHGTAASAQAAGFKAQQDLGTVMNNNSNFVQSNPDSYDGVRDSQKEYIDAQVKSGALTPSVAKTMGEKMDIELGKSAIRGVMQSDYNNIKAAVVSSGGKVDPNIGSLNNARGMLDGGHFDEVLDSDSKKGLYQEIKSNQSSAQSAGIQQLAMKQNALTAQSAAAMSAEYVKIKGGGYDAAHVTQLVQKGVIDYGQAEQLNHIAEASQKQVSYSNPTQVKSLMDRIYSADNAPGHIFDQSELTYMVGKSPEEFGPGSQKIGIHDYNALGDAISMAKGPQRYAQAQLMSAADAKIGNDPGASFRGIQFQQMVGREVQAAQSAGKPVGPLLDPNSKDYLGNRLPQYMLSPPQALAAQANAVRGGAPPPADIKAQPGVIPAQTSFMDRMNAAVNSANKTASDETNRSAPSGGSGGNLWDAAKGAYNSVRGMDINAFVNRMNAGAGETANSVASAGKKATAPDISKMSMADIGQIDPATATPSQRAAVQARLKQLRGGR